MIIIADSVLYGTYYENNMFNSNSSQICAVYLIS